MFFNNKERLPEEAWAAFKWKDRSWRWGYKGRCALGSLWSQGGALWRCFLTEEGRRKIISCLEGVFNLWIVCLSRFLWNLFFILSFSAFSFGLLYIWSLHLFPWIVLNCKNWINLDETNGGKLKRITQREGNLHFHAFVFVCGYPFKSVL